MSQCTHASNPFCMGVAVPKAMFVAGWGPRKLTGRPKNYVTCCSMFGTGGVGGGLRQTSPEHPKCCFYPHGFSSPPPRDTAHMPPALDGRGSESHLARGGCAIELPGVIPPCPRKNNKHHRFVVPCYFGPTVHHKDVSGLQPFPSKV